MTIFGGPDTEPIRRFSAERVMTGWASVSPVWQITLAKRAKSWIQSRSGWGPTGDPGALQIGIGSPTVGIGSQSFARARGASTQAGSPDPRIDPCCMMSISPRRIRGFPCLRRQGGYGDTVSLDALEALLSDEQHPGATSGAGGAGVQSPIPRFSITSASTSAVTSFLAASSSAASASASAWSAASWAAAASAAAWLAASWAA